MPRVAVPLKTRGYCRRCGEEIELANGLECERDIDWDLHVIFVRQAAPTDPGILAAVHIALISPWGFPSANFTFTI